MLVVFQTKIGMIQLRPLSVPLELKMFSVNILPTNLSSKSNLNEISQIANFNVTLDF